MRFISLSVIAILLITVSSCKNKSGDVDINFKLTYDGTPLVMLDQYNYPDGKELIFNRFSFFISSINLSGDGISHSDETVKMLNFTNANSTASSAAAGLTYVLKDVMEGNYTSFSFCVGVPSDLNSKKPSQFSNSDDLSTAAEYWEPWQSYIFSRTEGFIDLNNDGVEEKGFALHTGSDAAMICLDASNTFQVTEEGAEIVIQIDLKKLFGANPVYDIEANPQIHSLSQTPQVLELAQNLSTCFSLVK